MRAPDLTVAVTAHAETIVGGPTMRSAEAAIRVAEECGLRVERLIALDSASDGCREFFSQAAFASWSCLDLRVRDLGLARNALAEHASGRWVAWLGADDLFSENWLKLGAWQLLEAEKAAEKVVAHPEMNWIFDGAGSAYIKPDQHGAMFLAQHLYFANYFDSLCMAPRRAFLEVPYAARDRENGFGYEDWHWNIATMQAGWRHVPVKDTVIFKRRQDMSLVIELGQKRSVVAPMNGLAIDNIDRLGRSAERRYDFA